MNVGPIDDIKFLNSEKYLRQRLKPTPGDEFYIPLSDMLLAVQALADFSAKDVLDYGCGGSPYQQFFAGRYVRADIAMNPSRDLTIGRMSLLPCESNSFDHIISSQVLEHVDDPSSYLQESWRVLRPGGTLFLSTHGLYEDHGSPDDFWRWTAGGLSKKLAYHGFIVEKVVKLTCGARAAIFLLERELKHMGRGRDVKHVYPTLFAILRKLGQRRLHVFSDSQFAHLRMCDAWDIESPSRYVGLALLVKRP